MHIHTCRHCIREFVCDEPLDCFKGIVTCTECFWRHDVPIFLSVCFLGIVAIALTVVLFRLSNY